MLFTHHPARSSGPVVASKIIQQKAHFYDLCKVTVENMRTATRNLRRTVMVSLIFECLVRHASGFSVGIHSTSSLLRPRSSLRPKQTRDEQLQVSGAMSKRRCHAKPMCATALSEAPIVVVSAFAAVGAGTLGSTRLLDALRGVVTASPAVGPEAWRRFIESLPLILGTFYAVTGLACQIPKPVFR